jgi:hypothetical protein
MASLAQMERELIVERTRAGLGAARKLGRVGGRPRRMTTGKIESARQLLAGGIPPRDVARNLAIFIKSHRLLEPLAQSSVCGLPEQLGHTLPNWPRLKSFLPKR